MKFKVVTEAKEGEEERRAGPQGSPGGGRVPRGHCAINIGGGGRRTKPGLLPKIASKRFVLGAASRLHCKPRVFVLI